jgi:hypothetical protein
VQKLFFLRCDDCELMRFERHSGQPKDVDAIGDSVSKNRARQQRSPKTAR